MFFFVVFFAVLTTTTCTLYLYTLYLDLDMQKKKKNLISVQFFSDYVLIKCIFRKHTKNHEAGQLTPHFSGVTGNG